MSWANRELREEIRGFFFAHNRFRVIGCKSSSHNDFLGDVGSVGRANITVLNLDSNRFSMYSSNFFNTLLERNKLRSFTMRVQLGHMCCQYSYETFRAFELGMKTDWEKDGCHLMVNLPIHYLILLPLLQKLHFVIAFRTWTRYADGPWIPTEERCKEARAAVKRAVCRHKDLLLGRTGIRITVTTELGAPRLAMERKFKECKGGPKS